MTVAARRALLVLAVGSLLLCGGLGTAGVVVFRLGAERPTPAPITPGPTDKLRVPARDLWAAVASLVDAGDLKDSDELARLIVRLRKNERLTDADVQAFDAAFAGAVKTPRPLTPADAQTLRGLP